MLDMSEVDEDGGIREVSGVNSFENLQHTLMRNRRTRPPPIEAHNENIIQPRIPLRPEKLQRRESKGGLRSIFTRNKADKNTVASVPEEEDPVSARSARTIQSLAEASLPRQNEVVKSTIPLATPSSKPSRMGLRAKSVKQAKHTPKNSPKSTTKSATKSSNRIATRASPTWDPPPLFQAYPQAIKHAQLPALVLSADSIIRISNQKRNTNLEDQIAQDRASTEGRQTLTTKTTEKAKSIHRRQASGSISKADWTQKTFVLVTSGYLLQYAGEGSFDRLPEKMLLLGKDSVAFASDVIPGKHWVLQISQAMDSDGTPTTDSRSLFSRLAFRGADYRRTATSFLLVFNSAEEMDSWIAVVRREIESLGGKKHVSETGKPKADVKVPQLRSLVRDPEQFSNPASPKSESFGPPPWAVDSQLQDGLNEVPATPSLPALEAYLRRPPTSQQSISNNGISHDGRKLESLRDSGHRLSYMSSGQRTLVASQASSPAASPTQDTFEELTFKSPVEDIHMRPNVVAINERRRSLQPMHMSVIEAHTVSNLRPHSSYGPPVRAAPRTPVTNFSVPGNSSKRYSVARNIATESHPIPCIAATRSNRTRESILEGNTRRVPPKALNLRKPLSLATSPRSSRIQSGILLPAESSVELIQQIIPTAVNVPPRPPTLSSSIELIHPHQRSSLMLRNSSETAHADFQFPRRFPSMQSLHENLASFTEMPIEWPLTTPPVSPSFKGPRDNEPVVEILTESPPPSPVTTNTPARRPISMKLLPRVPPSQIPSIIEHTRPSTTLPTPQFTREASALRNIGHRDTFVAASPSLPRVKSPSANRMANRKSMPMLVDGPPPAPPPNCALPPLPPVNSPMRNSVRI